MVLQHWSSPIVCCWFFVIFCCRMVGLVGGFDHKFNYVVMIFSHIPVWFNVGLRGRGSDAGERATRNQG